MFANFDLPAVDRSNEKIQRKINAIPIKNALLVSLDLHIEVTQPLISQIPQDTLQETVYPERR